MLTSPANPLLKDLRRAIARGGLTDQGYLVAETFHLLDEALRSNLEVKVALVAESALAAVRDRLGRSSRIRLIVVEDAVFRKAADTESSQGVIMLAAPPSWTPDQALCGPGPALVLNGVQDPGNAGAMVRAAEAFGASGVLFVKGTVSPFNPKTLRAAAGSLFRVPFIQGLEVEEARAALDQRGIPVYVTLARGGAAPADADLARKCALVIGSEAHGVSEPLRRGGAGLTIPTAGVESLNAAAAAGIVLYEAQRQRTAVS